MVDKKTYLIKQLDYIRINSKVLIQEDMETLAEGILKNLENLEICCPEENKLNMIKNSDSIVTGRWICTQCKYKSYWIRNVKVDYFHRRIKYCPKSDCSAVRELDYEIKEEEI